MFLARNETIDRKISFHENTKRSSNTVELQCVKLDNNLNFKSHIYNIEIHIEHSRNQKN